MNISKDPKNQTSLKIPHSIYFRIESYIFTQINIYIYTHCGKPKNNHTL